MLFVFRKLLFLLLLAAHLANSAESIDLTLAPADQLKRQEIEGIARIVSELNERFPHENYFYFFIGRSPTPIMAFYEKFSYMFPHLEFSTLPLSEAGFLDYFLEHRSYLQIQNENRIDYVKKLFDHFDIYLEEFFLQLSAEKTSKKVVLIDFSIGGDSLGQTKRAVDWYVRYKAGQDSRYEKFLTIKTAYAAITHKSDHVNVIKASIDDYQRPYQPKISGRQNLLQFTSQSNGSELMPALVNVDYRVATINALSGKSQWYWSGQIIALDRLDLSEDLLARFYYQKFDQFSPYGAWRLEDSSLAAKKPAYRIEYEALKNSFPSCVD